MPMRRLIEIYPDHSPDDFPPDVKAALTAPERSAFADAAKAFSALAGACRTRALSRLIRACAEVRLSAIQLHAWEEEPLRAYFRFHLATTAPAVRLPRKSAGLRRLPEPLQKVYASVGGVQDSEFGFAGGLRAPDDITPIAKFPIYFAAESEVRPDDCFVFLDTLAGDFYGYSPSGRAVWWEHESGVLHDIGSLGKLLNRYFNGLVEGNRL